VRNTLVMSESAAGVTLTVRVIPRARKNAVAGTREGALLVRLAAPPVDGAANAALVAFLASLVDRPKRDVIIVSGGTSRDKRVMVSGMTAAQLSRRLSDILPA
jgi:uncharacterized protein (TIGR00251 family)